MISKGNTVYTKHDLCVYQYFSKGMQGTDITVQQHCPFTGACSLGSHTLPYIYKNTLLLEPESQ